MIIVNEEPNNPRPLQVYGIGPVNLRFGVLHTLYQSLDRHDGYTNFAMHPSRQGIGYQQFDTDVIYI